MKDKISILLGILALVLLFFESPKIKLGIFLRNIIIVFLILIAIFVFTYDKMPTATERSNTNDSSASVSPGERESITELDGGIEPRKDTGDSIDFNSENKSDLHENINVDNIDMFNATEFTLYISEKALEIIVSDEEFNREIGQRSITGAKVQLINFKTNEVIREMMVDPNCTATFSNLGEGIYSYKVMCDGYKTVVLQKPFKLKYDPKMATNTLPWSVELEKIGSNYSNKFKIRLVDKLGKALIKKSVNIGVDSITMSSSSYSTLQMYTNEDGYLTLWHRINDEDYYDVATFRLNSAYRIMINSDDTSITLDTSSNLYEYTLKFE